MFTDVEGSTSLLQRVGDEVYARVLADHHGLIRAGISAHGGGEVDTQGDGFFAVFSSASACVAAVIEIQLALGAHHWPGDEQVRVRMGVHAGEASETPAGLVGLDVHRAARVAAVAHGGQILLSETAAALAQDSLPDGAALVDLGFHRLKDLRRPQQIFQLVAPGLIQEFPRLASLNAVRHNLPVLRSRFVGRENELVELCDRVLGGQLVTLTGIGGTGKTRLALEAAARLVERFPQGVFFVDLAVVSDSDLVGQAVTSALDLHLVETTSYSLGRYLDGRRLLIVLDNCEHVLDACADLVGALLGSCPDLHILATSREPLGVDGEQVFRVPSLSVDSDAVQLFVDRAGSAGGSVVLDPAGAEVVAEICRRLDGIPLAIELAAARTTHLAPSQILERLSDRFRLLTGGRRRVQRQQTLSAAIDWSYDLLSEREQRLFRRLAVFRGSFSLEAVEEVCDPDPVDLLRSLIEKSLVNLERTDAAPRYRLLETVRLYVEERLLVSGEAERLRAAHRDWLLGWLESIPIGQLVGLGSGDSVDRVELEADNLSAALDWSLEQDRLDLVARMASRMAGYWWAYVRVGETGMWWRVLCDRLSELEPDSRALALVVGVQYATSSGDFEEMQRLSSVLLETAAPDAWPAAYAWVIQALYWTFADPQRGRRCIEEGRKSAAAAGVPEFERTNLIQTANLLTGDPVHDDALGARELIESMLSAVPDTPLGASYTAVGIVASLGDTARASSVLPTLPVRTPIQRYQRELVGAIIALHHSELETASEHLRALAAIVREHAIPLGDASCLIGFAALAARTGDHERASRHLATVRNTAPFPFRTAVEVLLYRQTTRSIRSTLDRDTSRRCRADGATLHVAQALDAELGRLDTASTARSPKLSV